MNQKFIVGFLFIILFCSLFLCGCTKIAGRISLKKENLVGNAIAPMLKDTKIMLDEYNKKLHGDSKLIKEKYKKYIIPQEKEYYIKYGYIHLDYIGNLDPWPTKTNRPYWKLKMLGIVDSINPDLKRFYLLEGLQTKYSGNEVFRIASGFQEREKTRDTIIDMMGWIRRNLNCDEDQQAGFRKRSRTAEQIIIDRCSTGCIDDTVVLAALARAKGIPATVTETVSERWIAEMVWHNEWDENKKGHVFSEVYLEDEDKWVVADPSFGLFTKRDNKGYYLYDTNQGVPIDEIGKEISGGKKYLLFERDIDSWDYGIENDEKFAEIVKKRYYVERGDQP